MRTLFLAWQAPQSRAWYPVGCLNADAKSHTYIFQYTQGALIAKRDGFHPVSAFPDMSRLYESSELFPLFQNRLIDSHRRGFAKYVQSLGMDEHSADQLEILAITGGERETDNFEVFPKLLKDAHNRFVCRFFLHGLSHCNTQSRERALLLQPQETLQILIELNNPKTELAVLLATKDYQTVGWSPRYLVEDLVHGSKPGEVHAKVIRNNTESVPLSRRILIEFSGVLPENYEPMSNAEFTTITTDTANH